MSRLSSLAFTIFAVIAAAAPVCGQNNVFIADKVVAVVGSSAVLYSDVVMMNDQLVSAYRQQGYTPRHDVMCEAFEKLLVNKILYTQSQIDSIKINTVIIDNYVDKALDDEVAREGSIAAVERKYSKKIHAIRDQYQKIYQENEYVTEMEYTVKSEVTISAGEVERFYRRLPKDSLPVIPDQYIFSQITKLPPAKSDAEYRAREQLLDIREKIINGAKFEAMATLHSADEASRRYGGQLQPMQRENFEQPFGDALVRLKPNQVSEIVETEYGFHIIQLLEKQGNFYSARHILIRPKYTSEEVAVVFSKLDSIRSEIISGNLRFDEAALKYSDDKYSKYNKGLATNIDRMMISGGTAKSAVTRFLLEELPAEDARQLKTMAPGEISRAYESKDMRENITGKIIRLNEIVPSHVANINDDYAVIEELALEDKKNKEFKKWLENKVAGMYIRIDPQFAGCQFNYKLIK